MSREKRSKSEAGQVRPKRKPNVKASKVGGPKFWKVAVATANDREPIESLAVKALSGRSAKLIASSFYPRNTFFECKGEIKGIEAASVPWEVRTYESVVEDYPFLRKAA